MEEMQRYAVYYAPRAGAFADAAAAWLGWDLAAGQAVAQPALALPQPMAEITAAPRKYGFHGTIKPPFRLRHGTCFADLAIATAQLAASLKPVVMPGLELANLGDFLALVPRGDPSALQQLAADVVQGLDGFRASLSDAETARRRPDQLTPRQRALLARYGYPYVMEAFRFHLTLTGPLDEPMRPHVIQAASAHFADKLPQPFGLCDLCLCGQDGAGRFHLLHRYALMA